MQGSLTAILAVVILALPVAGNAQETTSSIRGKVVDPAGSLVGGASIVVEDLRSGVERTYTTNDSGTFLATRLLPGGPYLITVNNAQSVEVPSISVGDTYNLTMNMQTQLEIEEIIAIGQQSDVAEVAAGPSSTFSLEDIENSVSFNRDISDVYGIDPRLMIDNDEDGFGVNCAGKHPRFNNITLDGVSTSDRFGLNENGYSTAVGMPFPFDSIEQIAIELAPFDVNYGGFSACNINAVTKSGTNEWEAKTFYEFSNNSMRGDTVAGDDTDFSLESYDKTYYGFDVGGAIIKDKLFVYAAYEKSEEPRFLARGYAGSGNGTERSWFTQDDFNRITQIASQRYGYDAGGLPGDGVQDAEKYLVRVDWNINDAHNAALIYSYFDGFQDRNSDDGGNRIELANHGYVKGAEATTYTAKLSSQWTDAFSTELFYSQAEMNDSQVTVGDLYMGEMQVSIGGNTVYLGADDSRQANKLSTDSEYFKLSANILAGNHVFTAGYDAETLDIFNIFVQHSRGGEYRFFDGSGSNPVACDALSAQGRWDDSQLPVGDPGKIGCGVSGMDRFELGRASRVYYGSGGGSNIANDAAAVFSNTLNALYFQDEIFFDNSDFTLVAGLRYEWYTSSDTPVFNQNFTDTTGVRNDTGLDGLNLLMPRVGFTWGVREDLTLRGGVGLYSGGNPNVWISNAWSNDGVTNAQFERRECSSSAPDFSDELGAGICTWSIFANDPSNNPNPDAVELSGAGSPGFDIPQGMVQDVLDVTAADANDRSVALIDPNYEQPGEWKLALGGTWDSPWADIQFDFDYLYTRGRKPAYYQDLSQEINTSAGLNGYTSLGTPIYSFQNGADNLMLTNANEAPVSHTVSMVMKKYFDSGFDILFGYAWTSAEDVAPMTSSTAGSNFDNTALLDVNYPGVGDSNWVVPHRFTTRLDYHADWFGDNTTRFTLQGYVYEGQPQSYAMQGRALEGDGFFGRHLLYIPDGPSDPNVVFGAGFDQAAFFDWVDRKNLKPGFTKRNGYNTGWNQRFDLRISQDIRFGDDFAGRLYLKIYNIGNLLSDDWGKVTDAEFFTPQMVTTASSVTALGQFQYTGFTENSIQTTVDERSLWEARFGIDFSFGR
jgi:hypothetical protein